MRRWSDTTPITRPSRSPVWLQVAGAEFYGVLDALEEISCMRDEREWAQVADTVRYFPAWRARLMSILRTCLDFDNGIVELVTVIAGQEKGSQPLERFLRLLFGGSL
jgi:Effector-associated domain 2